MWEKKSNDGGLNDMNTTFTWSTGPPHNGDGTVYTDFLTAGLNAVAFAGANDWRLLTFAELGTILRPEIYPSSGELSVVPIFDTDCIPGCTVLTCSCTHWWLHWSSTTAGDFPAAVWTFQFAAAGVGRSIKAPGIGSQARAVRGGL